jgi:TIR domain/Pentapeptide repeats (8 copies)
MANQEHIDILKRGVEYWNKWRLDWPHVQPDLREADLNGIELRKANLSEADLRKANLADIDFTEANLGGAYISRANLSRATFDRANLRGATLRGANLKFANLRGAQLMRADLTEAKLQGADLRDAQLTGTFLRGADLTETDLRGAFLWSTVFAHVDLRSTKGLVEVNHRGPSFVELHSVQLPQDGSMLDFLRNVGLPDGWIDTYRASMLQVIQYYSVFISYSSKDEMLAKRLYADLQCQGVRCWFAPEDMKIGDKIRNRIGEAIHLQDKLLLLLSENAISSTWVEEEVEAALEKERQQQRNVLFPICLDDSVARTTEGWAVLLRQTRHIGDFTRWTEPQAYLQVFDRLLRDLKAETSRLEEQK